MTASRLTITDLRDFSNVWQWAVPALQMDPLLRRGADNFDSRNRIPREKAGSGGTPTSGRSGWGSGRAIPAIR